MKDYYSSRYKKSFFRTYGFYFILAACIVALVAAAWLASSVSKRNDEMRSKRDASSYRTVSEFDYADSGDFGTDSEADRVDDASQDVISAAAQSEAEPSQASVASYFVYPVTGDVGLSYSTDKLQYSATYKDWRTHSAIDIKAQQGAPVNAAGDGVVKRVYSDKLWGGTVIIDHGNGVVATYCGVDNPTVTEGDKVASGNQIGSIGIIPCEIKEGTHLHFYITKDSKSVDPSAIISSN